MSITAPPARRHHGVPFGFVILLIASCLGTLAGELIKQEDVKKRIVMIIGENEYHTWETLPEFALKELEWRGYEVLYVQASPKDGDADFKNIEALRGADLVVISARRRTPPKAMMDLLRAHVAAGKPIVGIRTASHAFAAEPARADLAAWESFDTDVLGAHYEGHYNNKPPAGIQSVIETVAANASHPVLTGVKSTPFQVTSSLYKSRHPAHGTLILLEGHVDGGGTVEPVAWVNNAHNRRVFYTSLGNPDDFQLPAFRRLLLNGMLWCLHDPLPPASADIGQAASSAGPKAPAPAPVPGSAPAPVLPSVPPVADLPQDANGPALSPVEAQTRFHVADDLTWEQVLAEPQITQPVFLNFDARGRMWVRYEHEHTARLCRDRAHRPPARVAVLAPLAKRRGCCLAEPFRDLLRGVLDGERVVLGELLQHAAIRVPRIRAAEPDVRDRCAVAGDQHRDPGGLILVGARLEAGLDLDEEAIERDLW